MIQYHYGTQEIIRQCVTTGMQIQHEGKIWRASAKIGKTLYLHRLTESTRTTNTVLEVYLDKTGAPLIN